MPWQLKYLMMYRKNRNSVVLPNMNSTNTPKANMVPNDFNFQGSIPKSKEYLIQIKQNLSNYIFFNQSYCFEC